MVVVVGRYKNTQIRSTLQGRLPILAIQVRLFISIKLPREDDSLHTNIRAIHGSD